MNGNDASGSDPRSSDEKIVELGSTTSPVVMHRLAEVRRAKGIPRRVLAERLGITVRELRAQEESADVPISELCQWASVLDVPITELVVEPDESLAPTRLPRLQATRLMKVAATLRDCTRRRNIQRLAQTFVEQLAEILPELEQVAQKNHRHHGNRNSPPRAAVPRRLSESVFMRRRESGEQ